MKLVPLHKIWEQGLNGGRRARFWAAALICAPLLSVMLIDTSNAADYQEQPRPMVHVSEISTGETAPLWNRVPEPWPDLPENTSFKDEDGNPISLRDFKGKVLVVNFWATWCPPCVREMPALDRLAVKVKDLGIKVITISVDRGASRKIPPFMAKHDLQHLPGYYDLRGQLSRKMNVTGMPTTFIISADSKIAGVKVGELVWDHPAVVKSLIELRAAGETAPDSDPADAPVKAPIEASSTTSNQSTDT